MYNFFINVLDIFSEHNSYLKKTIFSFFSNPENELLRIKSSYAKKIELDKLILKEEKSRNPGSHNLAGSILVHPPQIQTGNLVS